MALPNFLVIGAQRAGTTLLHELLRQHPEVYMPERRKEIHFFDRYFDRGVTWYEDFFRPAERRQYRAIGEVTPDYLPDLAVPARVRDVLPDCRFIIVLRNPVSRAYSWYLYCKRNNNEKRSFEEFLSSDRQVIWYGMYCQQLRFWLDMFPRAQFHIMIYEALQQNAHGELGPLAQFLGLSESWSELASVLDKKVNTSELPRFRRAFALARRFGALLTRYDFDAPVRFAKRSGLLRLFGRSGPAPAMSDRALTQLRATYHEEVRRLEALLQRDLSVWQV